MASLNSEEYCFDFSYFSLGRCFEPHPIRNLTRSLLTVADSCFYQLLTVGLCYEWALAVLTCLGLLKSLVRLISPEFRMEMLSYLS